MFNRIPFMKITRILSLIALMAIAISCSKDDDDPQPNVNVENAAISFSENSKVLEVPQGLIDSEDQNAKMAAAFVDMANNIGANLALFTPPAGATKSTELITPTNGRTSATSGVVYYWSDPSYGSVAYQVRDDDDKYTFELLYKGVDDAGWYRYLYAQEMKDRSNGYMALYDVWGFEDDSRGAEMMRWEWTRKGDLFTFKMSDREGGFNLTISVNTKTKAGSLIYFEGSSKQSEIVWDAKGSGTWKLYDDTGAVWQEGFWTA